MKILEMKLKNFMGIRSLELKANGENLKVYGDNGTGKTTLFSAFTWLLFDKDSQNKTDFAIKTLDKDGNVIHNLDHEVEGVFEVDGETIVLRKVYREKYTKKRGSATEEFTGHETDHFIDGVPVKKNEYQARVAQIAPEERFKLLTSPVYFNDHLSWQKRREILLEVCGDVTDADVIKSNPELVGLPKVLGKHSIDDYKKIIAARRTEINRELATLPARIDEVTKGLPDISAIENPGAIQNDLDKLATLKKAEEAKITAIETGGDLGATKRQLVEVKNALEDVKADEQRVVNRKADALREKVDECKRTIKGLQQRKAMRLIDIKDRQAGLETYEERVTNLRIAWHAVNDRNLELNVEDTCVACGQSLPSDKVEAAKEKAIADFNTKKAKELEQINQDGKLEKERIERTKAEAKRFEVEVKEIDQELDELAEENAKLQAELAKVESSMDDYLETGVYKSLVGQRAKLEAIIAGDTSETSEAISKIREAITSIGVAESALLEARANLALHEQGRKRIRELEAQETALAMEFEKLEQELWLIEEFIRTKVGLLDIKINSKFKYARFKLFAEQINGAVNEVCETTYNGVPWNSLNNGARINVGLDIINTLSEHYGFAPPIFVDNAEAVTKLTEVNAQIITLIVSEQDKTLRVEGTGKAEPLLMQQSSLFEEAM